MLPSLAIHVASCVTLVLVSLLDYVWRDKRTRRHRRLRSILFVLLGALLLTGAWTAYQDQLTAKAEAGEAKRRHEALQRQLEQAERAAGVEREQARLRYLDLRSVLVAIARQRYPGLSDEAALGRLTEHLRIDARAMVQGSDRLRRPGER